jgi:hypothetical protein
MGLLGCSGAPSHGAPTDAGHELGGHDVVDPGDGKTSDGPHWNADPRFRAGFSRVRLTPAGFESFIDWDENGTFDPKPDQDRQGKSFPADVFLDTGLDGKFDFEEQGAFGADGKPGIAGVDDDQDGIVDDVLGCHPQDDSSEPGSAGCEYLALGSDDKPDPSGDNYEPQQNPSGTEGDGKWQKVIIGGYGGALTGDNLRPAKGVHDDLWARTLVVAQGDHVMALVALDFVGYLHIFSNVAKREIERRTGIPAHNIVVMANHNHDAPDVVGIWSGPAELDFAYIDQVQAAIIKSVVGAVAALRPARIKSATTEIDGCYEQQTRRFKKGSACEFPPSYAQLKATPSDYDVPVNQLDLRDPMVFNHQITALLIEDAETNATLGTLVNFHDHPEVLGGHNNQISSDFPHYAREELESILGGVAIYVSGTTGSQIGTLRQTDVPLYDESGLLVPDPQGLLDVDGKPFPAFAENDDKQSAHPPYDKIRSLGLIVARTAAAALTKRRGRAIRGSHWPKSPLICR